MNNIHAQLLSNAAATGSDYEWPGGWGVVTAEGDFSGGGTVSLQVIGPQGNWFNVGAATTLVANGMGAFLLPPGRIRAAVTGVVAAMYARAISIPRA